MNHFPSPVDRQLACVIPQEKKQILNYFKITLTSPGVLIPLQKLKSQNVRHRQLSPCQMYKEAKGNPLYRCSGEEE